MAPVSPRQKSTYSCPSTSREARAVRLGGEDREAARPADHPVHRHAAQQRAARLVRQLAGARMLALEALELPRREGPPRSPWAGQARSVLARRSGVSVVLVAVAVARASVRGRRRRRRRGRRRWWRSRWWWRRRRRRRRRWWRRWWWWGGGGAGWGRRRRRRGGGGGGGGGAGGAGGGGGGGDPPPVGAGLAARPAVVRTAACSWAARRCACDEVPASTTFPAARLVVRVDDARRFLATGFRSCCGDGCAGAWGAASTMRVSGDGSKAARQR